jgi:hypothetical protein
MRTALALGLLTVLSLVVCGNALAKGPLEAEITGPGLGTPITLGSSGGMTESPSDPLMELAEAAGFFPAVFERTPDPMLDERPSGVLGPRYEITYLVPRPQGGEDVIVQDLYPYAKPSAATYTEPGQTIFGTEQARGGWFVGPSAAPRPLAAMLVDLGLPAAPPTAGGDSGTPWTLVSALAALGGLLLAGATTAVVFRRRAEPATAR